MEDTYELRSIGSISETDFRSYEDERTDSDNDDSDFSDDVAEERSVIANILSIIHNLHTNDNTTEAPLSCDDSVVKKRVQPFKALRSNPDVVVLTEDVNIQPGVIVLLPVGFGNAPAHVRCKFCGKDIYTQVNFVRGPFVWLAIGACIVAGLIAGCCFVPFISKCFHDSVHSCPHCKEILARCSKL